MDMRSVRHQVEAQEWQKRIMAHGSSGLSVKPWCTENNARENRYYYWLHVLRNKELAVNKPMGIFLGIRTVRKCEWYNVVDWFPGRRCECINQIY